jgi:hypothetical protein
MAKDIQNMDGERYVYSYMYRRGHAPFCQTARIFHGSQEQTLEHLRQTKPIPVYAYNIRVYPVSQDVRVYRDGVMDLTLTEEEINQFRR